MVPAATGGPIRGCGSALVDQHADDAPDLRLRPHGHRAAASARRGRASRPRSPCTRRSSTASRTCDFADLRRARDRRHVAPRCEAPARGPGRGRGRAPRPSTARGRDDDGPLAVPDRAGRVPGRSPRRWNSSAPASTGRPGAPPAPCCRSRRCSSCGMLVAIAADVWTYNPRYITGVELPRRIPIEEAAVLPGDPAVRAAHLQRRQRHARPRATRSGARRVRAS